jgi:hypothetical protein
MTIMILTCTVTYSVWTRTARFFLAQHTKTGKNIPNYHKLYQMAIKYTTYQHLPLQDHQKFAQIGIFGLKIYHPWCGLPLTCRLLDLFKRSAITFSHRFELFAAALSRKKSKIIKS